jgi:MFS family permease
MPQDSAEYNFSKKQVMMGVIAIFAVYGTMSYFVQSLTVARPKMTAELNGMPLYALAVSIPALVAAFTTLIYGKLSDLYGRRKMLLVAVIFSLISAILCAVAPTFQFLIAATVIGSFGTGAMMPLVYAAIGDLFPPEQRGKWIGLLHIPVGFFSLVGPLLGGWFVDHLSWRYLYLIALPLLLVCLVTVPIGVPSIVNREVKRKIDYVGCILIAIASSAAIIGLSFAGKHGWSSSKTLITLGIAVAAGIVFLLVERMVEEPIVDPSLLRNRSFMTVSIATLLSFLGQMGMMMYFPMFLQGVQKISTTHNGLIMIPSNILMAFVSVPIGFLLSRSKRFKWMYVAGVGLLTLDLFGVMLLSSETHVVWDVVVSVLAGIGLGALPVINTMVVQNAVPKRMLGVAMGAFFFCFSIGMAIAPAILDSAKASGYEKTLAVSLPQGLDKNIHSLCDEKVLLIESARSDLERAFGAMGTEGNALYIQTYHAIREAMQSGIRSVFLVGAIAMLMAFLLVCTIPENSIGEDLHKPEQEPAETAMVS